MYRENYKVKVKRPLDSHLRKEKLINRSMAAFLYGSESHPCQDKPVLIGLIVDSWLFSTICMLWQSMVLIIWGCYSG